MVELVEDRDAANGETEAASITEVVGGVALGLVATVGPWLATGGALECGLPLAAAAGPIAVPDDADVRWYTSRALLLVGVVGFIVNGLYDPLGGDTEFNAAVAAILVGAALARTDDE